MSELSAIYCFGESSDRKSPLYVWGPSASQLVDPVSGEQYTYQDGTKNILEHFREVWRWHTESFSFGYNSYKDFKPPTQADWHTPCPLEPVVSKYVVYQDPYYYDADGNAHFDAYALVPIELKYDTVGGVAYYNEKTGLTITHFPAIHTRRGAISYKVEFRPPGLNVPPITMIYSGDTRPNTIMLDQAKNIDVLVHELVMPPDQWAAHILGVPVSLVPPDVVDDTTTVVNSSHTTDGALGYMLSQWMAAGTLPRLTAATHFQAQDDTVDLAMQNIAAYGIPRERYTFAADFMVLNVTSDKSAPIRQRRANVSHYAFAGQGAEMIPVADCNVPKYHDADGASDPYAQIDDTTWIPWSNYNNNGQTTYKETGYSDSTLTPKVYMPSVKSKPSQPASCRVEHYAENAGSPWAGVLASHATAQCKEELWPRPGVLSSTAIRCSWRGSRPRSAGTARWNPSRSSPGGRAAARHIQALNPRAVMFDRSAAQPDFVLRLLCERPSTAGDRRGCVQ